MKSFILGILAVVALSLFLVLPASARNYGIPQPYTETELVDQITDLHSQIDTLNAQIDVLQANNVWLMKTKFLCTPDWKVWHF